MTSYADLASWATPRQLEYIEAIEREGSIRKAGKALQVNKSVIDAALAALRRKAARQGYSPRHDMLHTVPDGYMVKGVSTYYDETGKPRGQWVKSAADQQRQAELLKAAAEAFADELPRAKPIPAPTLTSSSLCNCYTLTDCHVGMLAWHKEGGADWDVGIAESVLMGCFSHMVDNSPPAESCVIAQLGDFLHSDGLQPVTPTSGHILDQDGRFSKIVQAAIRVLRGVIAKALTKHRRVVLLVAEGNHDLASSVWLRCMFRALYENEPRVTVIDSELPYYVHQHGATMLCWHHGHLKKNDDLPLLFAAQFPAVWGSTQKIYAHTGHRHHHEEKEHSGMTVIQHPTLAARDAYAARGGWVAERQATAMTFHDRWGLVARNTVTPEMLAA